MKRQILRSLVLLVILALCAFAFTVAAQDQVATPTVTDDQVNAIAKKLYCPVCENITLDTCGTAACADWRAEIRLQLQAGRSEDQIINDFVTRFGDRVVGTPEDTALRVLSLVTPWVIMLGVLLLLGQMLLKRRRAPAASASALSSTQKYHEMIEQDLEG